MLLLMVGQVVAIVAAGKDAAAAGIAGDAARATAAMKGRGMRRWRY